MPMHQLVGLARSTHLARRLGAGGLPVFVQRLQLFDGHAAVIFAGRPARHQCLVAVAQRPSRQKLAVKLLEDLEARIRRGTRRGLGFFFLGRLFFSAPLPQRASPPFSACSSLPPTGPVFAAWPALAGLAAFFSASSFDIDLTLLSLDSLPTHHAAVTRRVTYGGRPDEFRATFSQDERASLIKKAAA